MNSDQGGNPDTANPVVDEALQSAPFDEAIVDETRPESRDEELERLHSEVADANNRVLMAQADLENFRKRMRRDMEDQIRFASIPIVSDLLHVRDNLVRAAEAAKSSGTDSSDALLEGVKMLVKHFDDTLAKHGISPIESVGRAFDPNFHQAISQMPNSQFPNGTIAYEAVTGFQMHGRVVRPSQVIVSTGSE